MRKLAKPFFWLKFLLRLWILPWCIFNLVVRVLQSSDGIFRGKSYWNDLIEAEKLSKNIWIVAWFGFLELVLVLHYFFLNKKNLRLWNASPLRVHCLLNDSPSLNCYFYAVINLISRPISNIIKSSKAIYHFSSLLSPNIFATSSKSMKSQKQL